MRYPRICLCAILVCLFSCVETITGQETVDLKSLADSVRKASGKPNFLPLGMHFLELAKARKDTANISDAYAIITNHYYELGDTDSLRLMTYEYMDSELYVKDVPVEILPLPYEVTVPASVI